jgi:hypothetical protein
LYYPNQTIVEAIRFLFKPVLILTRSAYEKNHPCGVNETGRVGAKNAWMVEQVTPTDRERVQVMEEWIIGFDKTDLFQIPKQQ